MNVTTLINIINEANDVNDRAEFYKPIIQNNIHPPFIGLLNSFISGPIVYENNTILQGIKTQLNNAHSHIDGDRTAIGETIDQLIFAYETLEATATTPNLATALTGINNLYNVAESNYSEAMIFISETVEMKLLRDQFVIGTKGSAKYKFVMDVDIQLQRNLVVVHFLKDIFTSFMDKLSALQSKVGQIIASASNQPPNAETSSIVNLLNQSSAIATYAGTVTTALQTDRTKLLTLGQGLVKKEINVSTDTILTQVKNSLNTIIAEAPSKSTTHDNILNQLATYASGFKTSATGSAIESAASLATTRHTEAKNYHETSHLLKIAFNELDVFNKQLEEMTASTQERAFYSDYRSTLDKFHILSIYMEGTTNKFELYTNSILNQFLLLLSDQRFKVQQFDDKVPFALLPVRIETRFMTIKHVRDNISYSPYTKVLRNDSEASSIRAVKAENTLVEEVSPISGGTLQPPSVSEIVADKHELWVRIYPDDIAIHTHENLLSQTEKNDAQIYWNENWKALGDANLELGAWRVLCSSYGSQRAAWIISQTIPSNIALKPGPATTPPLPVPSLPNVTLRPATWSQQPHSRVMPGRFVVRVYSNNTWREVSGLLVPNPLPVGFDPMDPYTNYLDQNGGEINMPSELRWLTNFEEAEKIGMGIRIPLINDEKTEGFDRLLVLGLKLNLDEGESREELEDLFKNHHYSSGLALLPQGTPTNNTEETKSGFAGIEPGYEESFKTELGPNLFTTSTNHYDKPDGQRLAEALGINNSIFQHVANSNTFDFQESMSMNRALWPATLGYYLKNMLAPAVVQSTIDDTRTFFNNFVHGRGLIPSFRVRNQPYGVLTSTVYSRWQSISRYDYEGKLYGNVLDKLRNYWLTNFCDGVNRVNSSDTAPDNLITNILGLNASSIQFHQRVAIGSVLSSNIMQYLAAAGLTPPNPAVGGTTAASLLDAYYQGFAMGYFSYTNSPRIFSLAFAESHRGLDGPVIDTLALSETRKIQNLGNGHGNYIEWLESSPITYIRTENFVNTQYSPAQQQPVQPPKALLYLLLRHAWTLEYLDTAHCLLVNANVIPIDSWHNHELLRMDNENTPTKATAEQKDMLRKYVKAEVDYENELNIENVMLHLSTNTEYQSSGLTPKQYHALLRDRSKTAVMNETTARYNTRLDEYYVDQAQWSYLSRTVPQLSPVHSVQDYIKAQLNSGSPCIANLKEASDALKKLKDTPTARLERCFAEHLDTCSYRLDSWLNGLVNKRLDDQRAATPNGIYLGAYGILENPKPNLEFPAIHVVNTSLTKSWDSAISKKGQLKMLDLTHVGDFPSSTNGTFITPIQPGRQTASFIYLGSDYSTTLIEDPESGKIVAEQRSNPKNAGFVLAPSLNHAVAAAVMRAGYKAHQKSPSALAKTMSVTLNSDRVRKAIHYLEGIRNGQSLAALLGYKFERGLHERQSSVLTLDSYIFELRKKFPLVAAINTPTTDAEYAQTRHVVDGLRLLEAYSKTTSPFWFTGITGLGTGSNPSGAGVSIALEIEEIKKDLDAIGDLLLSESLYQVVRGNHERAGSVLQALGYAGNIPEPEIIKTPRQADTFTHRCVVQLSPSVTNTSWTSSTIRATTEPSLNNWLASQLPPPIDLRIVYDYAGNGSTLSVDMNDLELQPIDLLAIFSASESNQSTDASELSKRIIYYVRNLHNLNDDIEISVLYRSRNGLASTQRTIFELTPILQGLSRLVGNSRILGPDDFVTPSKLSSIVSPPGVFASLALYNRINAALTGLGTIKSSLLSDLSTAESTPTLSNLNNLRNRLLEAAQFGITNSIPESSSSVTNQAIEELIAQTNVTLAEMNKRFDSADTKLNVTSVNGSPNYPDINVNDHKSKVLMLVEIGKLIFGRSFRVFTIFSMHDTQEVQNAYNYTTLLQNAGTLPIESWMSGVARVRSRMGDYHKHMLLAESVRYNPANTNTLEYTPQRVLQFPVVDPASNGTDRWIAMKLQADYKIPLDAISMVVESDGSQPTVPITCGMVIDEWPEQIPINQVTAGIAINYDQPSSEAPQSIILAVTPQIKNYWLWNDLMDTLNETVDMAKIRAVEPDMIQDSPLSQVLPAVVAQMNGDGSNTSPSLDFARNIVSVPPGYNDPIDMQNF